MARPAAGHSCGSLFENPSSPSFRLTCRYGDCGQLPATEMHRAKSARSRLQAVSRNTLVLPGAIPLVNLTPLAPS